MPVEFCCQICGSVYPKKGTPFLCGKCGGVFDLCDLPAVDFQAKDQQLGGMWSYRNTFGLSKNDVAITLGEGSTPFVWETYQNRKIGIKQEFLNPTGSYKDRGTSLLVSHLLARGVSSVIEDSSGNAGASLAAYTARAGMHARVYVPASASGPKLKQISAHGADLVIVEGPRENAAKAVRLAANQGEVYASHAFMPFGLLGIATIAYELLEQMNMVPGTIIAPVGHGGLMWGIIRGFHALMQSGIIKTMPFMVGAQASACAPLVAAFEAGKTDAEEYEEKATLAEGVKVVRPVRGKALLEHMRSDRGMFIKVEEEEIMTGFQELALRGFFIEPTSALAWNALKTVYNKVPEPIVLILTGSGLKFQP